MSTRARTASGYEIQASGSRAVSLVASYARAQSFYEEQFPTVRNRIQNQSESGFPRFDTRDSNYSRWEAADNEGDGSRVDIDDEEENWQEDLPPNDIRSSFSISNRPILSPSIRNDEQTPLLPPSMLGPSSTPFFPRTDTFDKRIRFSLIDPTLSKKGSVRSFRTNQSFISNRLSVISSNFTATIEENRGNSSASQTLFNLVNVLIGVGLLGLPMSFSQSGWLSGVSVLVFCALVTNYTAKLLAKMMSKDRSLETYAEIMIAAFGPRARIFIYFTFALELGSLSIALVVLFGDTMSELFPSISSNAFKVIGYFIILPTQFLPIRFLSVTSLIGIASSFLLLAVLLIDGSIKPDLPGSLHQIMPTSLGPDLGRLPLSFGIIMAGFSGNAVAPSIYNDMKQKEKFNSVVDTAYFITFIVSILMAGAGYAMFGTAVQDQISKDLLSTGPALLNRFAMYAIAISPIVKIALISRPLIATIENLIINEPLLPRDDSSVIEDNDSFISRAPLSTSKFIYYLRLFLKPLISALAVILAIIIPSFEVVLSFLGSCSAFLVCAILPLLAYLSIGGDVVEKEQSFRLGMKEREILRIPVWERILCWILLIICSCMAITGTIWGFLPVDKM